MLILWDKDFIEHTFIKCLFTKAFMQKVFQWFNEVNSCQISPTIEEALFGIISSSYEERMKKKFIYTTLSMSHYIFSCKLNIIDKLLSKYNHENMY